MTTFAHFCGSTNRPEPISGTDDGATGFWLNYSLHDTRTAASSARPALAAIAAPAAAQDDPRFALVTSFPSPTVSFQWELSERFALRFEGSYNYRNESSDSTSGDEPAVTGPFGTSIPITTSTQTESTIHTGSIGVAGIFTIHRNDQLRLYVAPRVSIVQSSKHY